MSGGQGTKRLEGAEEDRRYREVEKKGKGGEGMMDGEETEGIRINGEGLRKGEKIPRGLDGLRMNWGRRDREMGGGEGEVEEDRVDGKGER